MQCSVCGAPVQAGMAFCPNCGTPYKSDQKAAGSGSPSSPQYDPTVLAPRSYEPTIAAQPPASPMPAQPYGGQPGNQYPPQPSSPYNNAQNAYGTPPPPNAYGAPYAAPYAPPPGSFMPQNQPPPKKGPNVGLIIGIIVLLIVVIGGGVLAAKALSNSGNQANTGTPGTTATTSNTTTTSGSPTTAVTPTQAASVSPSGSPISSTAAAIITKVETTSSIDSNFLPTHPTTQFKVGDVVYVTFHLNLTASGYVLAKVYADNAYVTDSTLTVTVGKYDHGYFQITYNEASAGAFELYWCLQSDCSDASLAAVAPFTVS